MSYICSVALLKAIQYAFDSSMGVGSGLTPLSIFTSTFSPASFVQRLIYKLDSINCVKFLLSTKHCKILSKYNIKY